MKNIIENLFSWKEVPDNKVLNIVYYLSIFNSIIYFFSIKENFICWPHFQPCTDLLKFTGLPYSYNENYFLVFVFGLLIFGAFNFYKKDYIGAWLCLLAIFLIRVSYSFFVDYNTGNFNYYDIYLMFIILFLPKKELFIKIAFVWFYFLASTIKLDESFVLAKYFTSMKLGAPIFDNISVIIFSNIVILMQMIGVWFLFSKNKTLRILIYIYMSIFHFYSGFIVSYRYIITSIPFLLVLFNPYFHQDFNIKADIIKDKIKNIPGILFLIFLLFMQMMAYIIPGDHKFTLEGNNYGFYMFEANYQCKNELSINKIPLSVNYTNDARARCDPYVYLQKYQSLYCQNNDTNKINWSMISSVNGRPFYQIVSEADLCKLKYKPFSHNSWIKSPTKDTPIIGYPDYNYYDSSLLSNNSEKNFISNQEIIKNNSLQEYLSAYLTEIKFIYWSLWILVLCFVIYKYIVLTIKRS